MSEAVSEWGGLDKRVGWEGWRGGRWSRRAVCGTTARPRIRFMEGTCEGHVNGVEREAPRGVRDRQHPFHAENIVSRALQQRVDPVVHELQIEIPLPHGAHVARSALVETH